MSAPMRYPFRQQSARGEPKPTTTIERTCQKCGASFLGLAAGKTGEVGIWDQMGWWCSVECYGRNPEPVLIESPSGWVGA